MRKISLLLPFAAAALFLAGSSFISAQNPAPAVSTQYSTQYSTQSVSDLKTIDGLLAEVQAQQKTLADNQALIDQKIATLTETIRTARIFSKRGGGAK